MKKQDPVRIILDNRDLILSLYEETDRNTSKTHELLKERLPELKLSLSQFKPLFKGVYITLKELNHSEQPDNNAMQEELFNLKEENQKLKQLLSEFVTETEKMENRLKQTEHQLQMIQVAKEATLKELDITKQQLAEKVIYIEKEKTPEELIKNMGWTPAKSGRYWRLFKRIRNQMYAIHHGRELDPEKAKEQIAKKEKEIGNDIQKRQILLDSVPQ